VTTDWIGFAGNPGRDVMWLVSSADEAPELAAAASQVRAGKRGIVGDAETATRIRAQLAAEASQAQLSRDRSTSRATLATKGRMAVARMELQHD
jgi:hypothetical protein